jgi:riboflavin-specific deaminase-like protein
VRLIRLTPLPGPTTVSEQLATIGTPGLRAPSDRPVVFTNFALSLDGHATIEGRSGSIGSEIDTAMLAGLREIPDALMVGAGTLRAERYSRIPPGEGSRARRQRRGVAADPLVVVISGSLNLPWDIGLFTDGGGRVLVVTASEDELPETATPVEVMRCSGGIDLATVLSRLRDELGVRSLLCEGGPRLHGTLIDEGLVDELFVTIAPVIAGGEGPGLVEALGADRRELELLWLLESHGELFARYRFRS